MNHLFDVITPRFCIRSGEGHTFPPFTREVLT
jgi:hypothetical protein